MATKVADVSEKSSTTNKPNDEDFTVEELSKLKTLIEKNKENDDSHDSIYSLVDQDKCKTIEEIDVEAYFENLEKQGELLNPDVIDKLI